MWICLQIIKYRWSEATNLSNLQYNHIDIQSIHFYRRNNLSGERWVGLAFLIDYASYYYKAWDMSASDIMISVAVRISVRVCQRVTSCEFACKSSNTDGVKQQTFQTFNTTTLAYNPSIFTVATTYRENVGSGWLSSLIRQVIIIRLRICQRVTSWLV